MECPENDSRQNEDLANVQENLEDSKTQDPEENGVTATSMAEEDCDKKGNQAELEEEVFNSNSVNSNNPNHSTEGLYNSDVVDSDLTPELIGLPTGEENTPLEDTEESNVKSYSVSCENNLSLDLVSSTGGNASTPDAKLSNSFNNDADSNVITPSSTPNTFSETKLLSIRCQSTPSMSQDSKDQTPQLSISTPELFSKTDAVSHGTPVSKENTSMSEYLCEPERDPTATVSLSPDNGGKSPGVQMTDEASQDEDIEAEGNFKVPQQMPQQMPQQTMSRHPEKRTKGDLSDNSDDPHTHSAPKRPCLTNRSCLNGNGAGAGADSRKSVCFLKEIRKSPPPMDSQDIQLQLSESQPESVLGLSSDSIVHLDEEDEIVEVPAEAKEPVPVPEIVLDASNRTPSPSPAKGQTDVSRTQSSLETEPVNSPADMSSRKTYDQVKRFIVTRVYAVECHLTIDAETGKRVGCNVLQFETRDTSIKEEAALTPSRRLGLDDSSGVLADESSPPSPPRSTRDSISSTVSGPGPFRLQPSALQRMSMFSTTSSSSTGSANNALPNKGLPSPRTRTQSNKREPINGVPFGQWYPGHDLEDTLKTSLEVFMESDSASSFNKERETKRIADTGTSLTKRSTLEDDIEIAIDKGSPHKKQLGPLSPVDEEPALNESKKTKKNVESPRTPSRRTPSQRLQTKKALNSGPSVSVQESPKSQRKRRGRPPNSPAPAPARAPAVKDSLTATATPKTNTPTVTPAKTESNWSGTPSTPGSSAYQPGASVFAMWTDRKLYPAQLVERVRQRDGDGFWQVVFLSDDKRKVLPERSLLLFSTFECDQPVLALTPDEDCYRSGVITEVKAFETKDDIYTVKLEDDSTVELTWRDLSLTELQAQTSWECRVRQKPASAKRLFNQMIDLDNVVHGKRLRSSRCSSPSIPSSSRSLTPANTTFEEGGAGESEVFLKISGIEEESPNVGPFAGKGSKRAKGRKGSTADKPRTTEEEKLLERLGPIPPPGSNLFSGLTFFITSTSVHLQHEHKSLNADLSSSSMSESDGYTDCECYVFSTLPIVKPRLVEQLTAGGGRVLSSVDQLEDDFDKKKTMVVTDRPCRTAIYIRCMALGIKSILHDWIVDCCKEMKALNVELLSFLPAGYSSVRKRFIQWSELKDRKVFSGKGVLIQSQNRSFVHFWEKVVRSAGAELPQDVALATVIVGESPLPDFLRLKAEAANVPVVSAHWVTQSIINGEQLSADATLTYSLQYSESE